MTFAEVKEILEKAKFNMCHCSIPEEAPLKVSDGVVATLKNGVYEVYFVDRYEAFEVKRYTNEDDASRDFLTRIYEDFDGMYDFPKNVQ